MWGFRGGLAFDFVDLGWFQAPGTVATDIRADSTFIRRVLPCRGQIRHDFCTVLTFLFFNFGFGALASVSRANFR